MTNVNDIKKRRDIRVVGYEKRLVVAQVLLLAALLLLPAMAVSNGWGAGFLCAVFFGLILAVFVQIWRLRETGVRVTIEELESESDESIEEPPAELPVIEETVEDVPPPAEPVQEQPRWFDLAYPDPDEELGLAEDSDNQADAQTKVSSSESDE